MKDIVVRLVKPNEAQQIAAALIGLYREAGWLTEKDNPDEAWVEKLIGNSYRVMGAFADDKIIGLMRALSDGISDAYLLDLVVAEASRGQGIATQILQALIADLKQSDIDWLVCISAPGKERLYSKVGIKMQQYVPFRFL